MKRMILSLLAATLGVFLVSQSIAVADDGHSKSRVRVKLGAATTHLGGSGPIHSSTSALPLQNLPQFQTHQKTFANSKMGVDKRRNLNIELHSNALADRLVGETRSPRIASRVNTNSAFHSALFGGVNYSAQHCQAPLTQPLWCQYHPVYCHWWWDCCGALQVCQPVQYCHWDWNYVVCPRWIDGVIVRQNCKWYLGVSGMLLPGVGLGVDEVASGSPADRAGIRPGMVVASANGIPLVDERSLQKAIAASNGVLRLEIRQSASDAGVTVTVAMAVVANVSL